MWPYGLLRLVPLLYLGAFLVTFRKLLSHFLQCVRKSLLFLILPSLSYKFRSLSTDCQWSVSNYSSRSLTNLLPGSTGEESLFYLSLKELPLDLSHTGREARLWYSFHLLWPPASSSSIFMRKFTNLLKVSGAQMILLRTISILLSWQMPSSQESIFHGPPSVSTGKLSFYSFKVLFMSPPLDYLLRTHLLLGNNF